MESHLGPGTRRLGPTACPPTLHFWDDEGALWDPKAARKQEIADEGIRSLASAIAISGDPNLSKGKYNDMRKDHQEWQSTESIRKHCGGFSNALKKARALLASEEASVLPCGADPA